MSRRIAMFALWLAPLALQALGIKVERVDRKAGRIQVLLPLHSVRLDAEALPDDHPDEYEQDTPDIRLRRGEFYEATIERRGTPVRNVLRVKVPGAKDAKYRVLTLTFLD